MTKTMPRVGLDVHANQTHRAMLDLATGELKRRRIDGPPERALDDLAQFGEGLIAVYEAGPTGFGLARAAIERGIDLRIAAPGLIPRGSADRVKTDRRDAERLARLLAAGELSFVRVPTVDEERFRDLVRCREDLRGDLMRARHRLGKLLLRRAIRYPGPGKSWTQRHRAWLGQLDFEDEASRATFDDYLAAVAALEQRRQTLDTAIERLWPSSPHAATIARLRAFRGIDTLTAAGICAEVGDFARFRKPALLAGHLGITPSERTSDEKRRQGSITKAGSTHARRLLVEAAHHYARRPAVGLVLRRRQEGQDPRVVAIAWRAQQRLHGRWAHLRVRRGKPAGKVAVAVARELSAFCWEAATLA
ncbi:MAG: IS110 family transposase [Thermoleophilaceae bacterium]